MTPPVHRPTRIRILRAVLLLSALFCLLAAAGAGPVTAQQATVGLIQARLQADHHYRAGLTYGERGRFADAARELSAAVSLDPTDPDAYVSLAEAEAELGRFAAAIEALNRALALAPNHLDAHYDLSRIYLERRQFDLAWRHARAVQELNPAMANALIGRLEQVSDPSR